MMAYVFQKYPENFACHLYIVLPMNFATFLKGGLLFNNLYCLFCL